MKTLLFALAVSALAAAPAHAKLCDPTDPWDIMDPKCEEWLSVEPTPELEHRVLQQAKGGPRIRPHIHINTNRPTKGKPRIRLG